MHTNHNRIKVSDLETDDPDKILVTNSEGKLEFIPTKNIKVDSYNALDYDQEGKALDARQGKILKDLVNNKTEKGGFQGTAQDLANSIAALQMPDKVLKYGQINLSGLTLSIDANTFAWVLNQIQFLTPDAYVKTITAATNGMYRTDIVVGNNSGNYEIIKGTEAATGAAATEPKVPQGKIKVGYVLVFGNTIAKLGNSQGVDLSGELRLPAYPNTRNDGQISMNKVLGTDMHGNLKMYTIATAPAPYLEELIPDSHLPSNTGNFKLRGSFFTPTMTIVIEGQIINYINFISDNEVDVNVTTGSMEGMFDVTLNNGLSATFPNVFIIVLGDVYSPVQSDWISVVPPLDITKGDEANIGIWNSFTSGILSKEFDYTKNFRVRFCIKKSPLGNPNDVSSEYQHPHIQFIDSTNSVLFFCTVNTATIYDHVGVYGIPKYGRQADWDWGSFLYNGGNNNEWWNTQSEESVIEIRHTEGILYAFCDNVLKFRFDVILTENIRMKVDLKSFDISKIKYIETA